MVRTQGSKSFSGEETKGMKETCFMLIPDSLVLLDHIERIRPVVKARWDEVTSSYNAHIMESGKDYPTRDCDALRRRFMVLAYQKKTSNTSDLLKICSTDFVYL